MAHPLPKCKKCGADKFMNVPDSLAWFCERCGFVWVDLGGGRFEVGATIQEWLEDTYGEEHAGPDDNEKPYT